MLLQVLFIIHLVIWIFAFLGGFLSKTITLFNILILLPFIYISQSLPYHPIVYMKMKYIQEHFKQIDEDILSKEEINDLHRLAIILNKSYQQILEYYSVYMENEDIITKQLRRIRKYFDSCCFRNPFSAQGLIIIGYILNTYVYFILYT
jgi:hypothetical protein